MTSTLHNNLTLLKRNHQNRQMLHIAKEIIEDERQSLKYNDLNKSYNKEKIIGNFTVKTLAAPINKYNCYELSVKVENDDNKVELNTYVTKK